MPSTNSIAVHHVLKVLEIRTDTYDNDPGHPSPLMVVTVMRLETDGGEIKIHFHHAQKDGTINREIFTKMPEVQRRFLP